MQLPSHSFHVTFRANIQQQNVQTQVSTENRKQDMGYFLGRDGRDCHVRPVEKVFPWRWKILWTNQNVIESCRTSSLVARRELFFIPQTMESSVGWGIPCQHLFKRYGNVVATSLDKMSYGWYHSFYLAILSAATGKERWSHESHDPKISKGLDWRPPTIVTLNHLLGGGNSNIFYFTRTFWGNDPIWRAYFSNGLVQPPASLVLAYVCSGKNFRRANIRTSVLPYGIPMESSS